MGLIEEPYKVILDTNIIANVEQDRIAKDDWRCVCTYLRHVCTYAISALTVGELILGLANSDPQYFAHHLQRLRILLQPDHDALCFDFVRYFVAPIVGIEVERPSDLESNILLLLKQILQARTKEALLGGFHTEEHGHLRINLESFTRQFEAKRNGFLAMMESRRVHRIGIIPETIWAQELLRQAGAPLEAELVARVISHLSANYEFEMSVNTLVGNPQFSISKNRNLSLLVDGQQLMYLADPRVVFVTSDSDFRNKVQRSEQRKRIVSFDQLLHSARSGSILVA